MRDGSVGETETLERGTHLKKLDCSQALVGCGMPAPPAVTDSPAYPYLYRLHRGRLRSSRAESAGRPS